MSRRVERIATATAGAAMLGFLVVTCLTALGVLAVGRYAVSCLALTVLYTGALWAIPRERAGAVLPALPAPGRDADPWREHGTTQAGERP